MLYMYMYVAQISHINGQYLSLCPPPPTQSI